MLDMKVSQLTIDPFTNMPIIILKDEAGHEALPIWIGLIEASAIASELEKIALDRPMTHDLMRNIIDETGLRVDRVEVHDVRDNTYYATIFLVGPRRKTMALDSRPSDAIALALRTGARICVARKVIDRTRHIDLSRRAGKADARHKGGPKSGQRNGPKNDPKYDSRSGAKGDPKGDNRHDHSDERDPGAARGAGGGFVDDAERLRELLESLSDDEFGKWKM
jgi:bifunctional DNase/RNase